MTALDAIPDSKVTIKPYSQKHPTPAERARLVPVFTDQSQFIRSAALDGPDQAHVLVINRDGEVLARAEGAFDADKADKLRETLRPQHF